MRAQAHTLEAIVASLLILTSLIFAIQIAAVTPLSATTSSQHIQNQQRAVSQGVLGTAADQGALKSAILYWNNSSAQFHNVSESSTTSGPDNSGFYNSSFGPNNEFSTILQRALGERNIAYNIYFEFTSGATGSTNQTRYIYNGVPSDNAVTAVHTVTLMDRDHLINADGSKNSTTLGDGTSLFGTQKFQDRGDAVYNTVRVKVVTWRN